MKDLTRIQSRTINDRQSQYEEDPYEADEFYGAYRPCRTCRAYKLFPCCSWIRRVDFPPGLPVEERVNPQPDIRPQPVSVVDDSDWNKVLLHYPILQPVIPIITWSYKEGEHIDAYCRTRISLVRYRFYLKVPAWYKRELFKAKIFPKSRARILSKLSKLIYRRSELPLSFNVPAERKTYKDIPPFLESKPEKLTVLEYYFRNNFSVFIKKENNCPPPPPPPLPGALGSKRVMAHGMPRGLISGVGSRGSPGGDMRRTSGTPV